jgi:hypothetical protein
MYLRLVLSLWLLASVAVAEDKPLAEAWEYAPSMQQLAATFRGQPGVVLHIGDELLSANAYGQWARYGRGRTAAEIALLQQFHLDAKNSRDGWWLVRTPHFPGGTYTACSTWRMDQLLHGGRSSFPRLATLLKEHEPQIVVLLLGRQDLAIGRKYDAYRADAERAVDTILAQRAICILCTLPPYAGNLELSAAYNRGLRELAAERKIPLLDFEREILTRRPEDWNGTLMNRNDYLPTVEQGAANPAAAPTAENLRESGYLLLGWLSTKKILEVSSCLPAVQAATSKPE